MSTFTNYKRLEKPLAGEKYNINVANKNNDIIDSELHKLDLKNQSQDELLATKQSLNSEIQRAMDAENINSNNLKLHKTDASNPHSVTKSQVGLGNVDNTSDMDKPVSTAQQNTLDTALSTHNTSEISHSDLRLIISGLTTRLNALADSDDTTLDQLSEIVAYIKNNKSLIDGVTTSKVNVSDIIDDLTSSAIDKPISAKQGMILKGLITDLTTLVGDKVDKIPGKGLSTNDYTTEEKNKLNSIASGAKANIQSDWNVTDTTSDAFIKNKPASISVKGNMESSYRTGNVNLTSNNIGAQSLTPTESIPSEADLNDYDVVGCYVVGNASIAKSIVNSPTETSGYMLSVYGMYGTGTEATTQIVQTYFGDTYIRSRLRSDWSNWIKRKYTDTTYTDMIGATQNASGKSGLVPAPASGDKGKFLRGDGTWEEINFELVDPMTAANEGFAADAKLTGDVLKTLKVNLHELDYEQSSILQFRAQGNTYVVPANGIIFLTWRAKAATTGTVGITSQRLNNGYVYLNSLYSPNATPYSSSQVIVSKDDILTANIMTGVDGNINGSFIPYKS